MTPHRSIPLNLLTVSEDGKATINKDLLLDEREKFIPLDTSKPFKLNADTTGFCRSRLALQSTHHGLPDDRCDLLHA